MLASIVDISERKQAELEAARQRHDLAHLARVTTLGELSSSLAHELTHPITAILSNYRLPSDSWMVMMSILRRYARSSTILQPTTNALAK